MSVEMTVSEARAELLERIEDLIDAEAVRGALSDLDAGTEERVPFVRRTRDDVHEMVRRHLGR